MNVPRRYLRATRVLAFSSLLTAAHATAQAPSPARDPAAAEVLFDEGRQALDSGDFAAACRKFAESQRLDPAAGTLMNWATCEEKLGKIASAWQHYEEAVDQLPPDDDRVPFAKQQIARLEHRLPHLTLRFSGSPPEHGTVLRDGLALRTASLNTSLPVDPGEHTVKVRAPGHEDREYTFSIKEGESRELSLELGPLAPQKPATASKPVLPWVLLGVGAAGIVGGVVTSVMIDADDKTVADHCVDKRCDPTGLDAANRGQTLLWVNAASFGVGVAGVGAGLILLLTSDSPGERSPEHAQVVAGAAPDGAFLGVRGAF
jgi:hypothetical protein